MQAQHIDETTGEILVDEGRALIVIPDASELQRYQTDEALIELTEQVLAVGKTHLEKMPSLGEVVDARAKVRGYTSYLNDTIRDREKKIQARNNLADLVLRQQRHIGKALKTMPKGRNKGRPLLNGDGASPFNKFPTLDDLGITNKQSSRWQKEVEVLSDDEFEDIVTTVKENLWELSSYDLVKHPGKGYDGDEWYTPSDYIEAARALMGGIDCDPASCELAQRVVKASTYFTIKDDGLEQNWHGRVWLNPPYSQPKIEQFTERLSEQYDSGNVSEAVLLVNNCTDAGWFVALARRYPVMFSEGRAKFWQADQKTFATRQGQAIFYLGNFPDRFHACFLHLAYAPNMFIEIEE